MLKALSLFLNPESANQLGSSTSRSLKKQTLPAKIGALMLLWGTQGLIGLGNGRPGLPMPAEFRAFGFPKIGDPNIVPLIVGSLL